MKPENKNHLRPKAETKNGFILKDVLLIKYTVLPIYKQLKSFSIYIEPELQRFRLNIE